MQFRRPPTEAQVARAREQTASSQLTAYLNDIGYRQSDRRALGQYMTPLLRAVVVGRTLVGMRADDAIRAVSWLASRSDVDGTSVTVYGKGAQGIVALHAGLHKNLSEVLVPSVLTRYDVGDLLQAISPRPVALVNPVNPMGQRVREALVASELSAVFETDRNLGAPGRVRVLKRRPPSPLPIGRRGCAAPPGAAEEVSS